MIKVIKHEARKNSELTGGIKMNSASCANANLCLTCGERLVLNPDWVLLFADINIYTKKAL